jgi:hypothetical protein
VLGQNGGHLLWREALGNAPAEEVSGLRCEEIALMRVPPGVANLPGERLHRGVHIRQIVGDLERRKRTFQPAVQSHIRHHAPVEALRGRGVSRRALGERTSGGYAQRQRQNQASEVSPRHDTPPSRICDQHRKRCAMNGWKVDARRRRTPGEGNSPRHVRKIHAPRRAVARPVPSGACGARYAHCS